MAEQRHGLRDIWNATNSIVQAINALTRTLTGAILTGPQGTTGPVGASGIIALRSYLAGLTLSNDGGSPNTVLDIAAGVATDTTATITMSLGAFTKSISGSWVSGTGNNGMGQGLTIAASTWYHVILANNGGTPDVYFDTSATGANKPSGITDAKVRRIGSFLTDGSSHIIAFSQNGDEFLWPTSVNDILVTNLSTTGTLFTLTVPTGVKVNALFRCLVFQTTVASLVILTSPDESDQVPSAATGLATQQAINTTFAIGIGHCNIRTDTSARIRARASTASTNVRLQTFGWIDRRGRDA